MLTNSSQVFLDKLNWNRRLSRMTLKGLFYFRAKFAWNLNLDAFSCSNCWCQLGFNFELNLDGICENICRELQFPNKEFQSAKRYSNLCKVSYLDMSFWNACLRNFWTIVNVSLIDTSCCQDTVLHPQFDKIFIWRVEVIFLSIAYIVYFSEELCICNMNVTLRLRSGTCDWITKLHLWNYIPIQ